MPPTPLPTQPFSYVAGDAAGYDRRRSYKTAPRHAERETPRAGKDIQRKVSFACNAIMMNSTIFYTASLGPLVGVPAAMYAPPLRYKREALAGYRTRPDGHKLSQLSHSRGEAIQHTVDVGYYAPAARTTPNPAVFIVFLSKIDLRLANPGVHTLWA